jgi:hypothetical protein
MDIGNILPDQKVVIKIQLIGEVKMFNSSYEFRIPSAYCPKQYLPLDMGEG